MLGYEGDQYDAFLTRIRARYTSTAVDQDLQLYFGGSRNTVQTRYIEYNEALAEHFPVCFIGMVEGGGTCQEEPVPTGAACSSSIPQPRRFPALPILFGAIALLGVRRRRYG